MVQRGDGATGDRLALQLIGSSTSLTSANPRLRDTVRLRTFRKEYPDKARAGLLLHNGETVEWLAPDVLATPWWRVI